MKKEELKEFNSEIQICPDCDKIDVYKNDGHTCDKKFQEARAESQEHYN